MTLLTDTNQNRSGFYIEVGCPGCGGEVELDQDFFVLTCRHCSSALRVGMPAIPPAFLIQARTERREIRFHIDRYLKELGHPLTGSRLQLKSIYYPYWKIDAVMLKVRNRTHKRTTVVNAEGQTEYTTEVDRREISLAPYSTTVPAGRPLAGLPGTIGVRADCLRMVPYSREYTQDDFCSMPVARTWDSVHHELLKRARAVGTIETPDFGSNRTELFNPQAALVYFPYVLAESYASGDYDRFIIDGVTGKVVGHRESIEPDDADLPDLPVIEFGQLRVDFHRCPECGIDLPIEQSLIYRCVNCGRLVNLDPGCGGLIDMLYAMAPTCPRDRLFPFWSIALAGDQARLIQHQLGGLRRAERLVVPAFQTTAFEGAYRLTRRATTALPDFDLHPLDSNAAELHPVNVTISQAILLAEVIIYRAAVDRVGDLAGEKPELHPSRVSLVFLPFHPESYFYVDSVNQAVTFEKRLLG